MSKELRRALIQTSMNTGDDNEQANPIEVEKVLSFPLTSVLHAWLV